MTDVEVIRLDAQLDQVTRERDEARKEAEEQRGRADRAWLRYQEAAGELAKERDEARRERDSLRTEVMRLRESGSTTSTNVPSTNREFNVVIKCQRSDGMTFISPMFHFTGDAPPTKVQSVLEEALGEVLTNARRTKSSPSEAGGPLEDRL